MATTLDPHATRHEHAHGEAGPHEHDHAHGHETAGPEVSHRRRRGARRPLDRGGASPLRLSRRLRGAPRDPPCRIGRRREGGAGRPERRREEHADAPPQWDPSADPRLRTVGGTLVDRKSVKRIRAEVGLVFQDPDDQLFSPTVFEDVAFGPLHMGRARGDPRPGGARPGRRRDDRLRAAAAPSAVARSAQARRARHRPLDGPLGPRVRRAVGRPRPARPSRAHRPPPLARPDAARLDPRHAARRRGLPPGRRDGRRAHRADGPTDRILADDTLLEAHGLERP